MMHHAAVRSELLGHPLRLRILSLVGDRTMTASQIAAEMPDVPRPTAFRHVHHLVEGGALRVVRETAVRGATERWLAIPAEPESVGPTGAERELLVSSAFAGLLSNYRRALVHHGADLPPAKVSFETIRLSPEDVEELQAMVFEWARERRSLDPSAQPYALVFAALPEVRSSNAEELPFGGLG